MLPVRSRAILEDAASCEILQAALTDGSGFFDEDSEPWERMLLAVIAWKESVTRYG
jgi:hypothetical protein